MRRKGDPRDPMHTRKHTKHSDICRGNAGRERAQNEHEDPPNRKGRSLRRAAERKAKASKKEAAPEETAADLIAGTL